MVVPTASPDPTNMQTVNDKNALIEKLLKIAKITYDKENKKIIVELSVKDVTIQIKISSRKYKKHTIKGKKKYDLKIKSKLKKNAKIVVTINKKGYKTVELTYLWNGKKFKRIKMKVVT